MSKRARRRRRQERRKKIEKRNRKYKIWDILSDDGTRPRRVARFGHATLDGGFYLA